MTLQSRRTFLALGGLALLSGCGGAPPVAPPTGIDDLQIPTRSPAPADFVRRVDHPLLALDPATERTFEVAGSLAERVTQRPEAPSADPGPLVTTPLVTRLYDGHDRLLETWRDLLAQDRAGNVWWLGHEVAGRPADSWTALDAPGLYLAARPRLGDGYLAAAPPEGDPLHATVISDRIDVDTPAGEFADATRIELRGSDPTTAVLSSYAAGAGLIARSGGPWGVWRLPGPPR